MHVHDLHESTADPRQGMRAFCQLPDKKPPEYQDYKG